MDAAQEEANTGLEEMPKSGERRDDATPKSNKCSSDAVQKSNKCRGDAVKKVTST